LEQLVELYLDPEIASPRKVSVWYSFWGEASSRQEYLDLCGKKDEDFAALVHELIEGVIAQTGQTYLDADGVALGLIGVLEVLWQGIAFNSEAEIDREGAKRRSFAYLRSVFPGQFAATAVQAALPAPGSPASVPGWAYSNSALLALERDRLFRPSWQLVGHEADIPKAGDYLTAELAGERVLVVRTPQKILAFRNTCRKRPHALLMERSGHLTQTIECSAHELTYGLDGKLQSGSTPGDLTPLELALPGKFILVRALAGRVADPASAPLLEIAGAPTGDWESLPDLKPAGSGDLAVAADWKLMVEQWLEALPRPKGVRRSFLAPNQLLEVSTTEALVLQVVPESPGRCRIRRLDYSVGTGGRRKPQPNAGQVPAWLEQDIEVAESMQAGLTAGIDAGSEAAGPVSEQLEEFRAGIAVLLPLARGS
jgi:nitrite reductase/ring-hydroxylating ferredoxin subunit